ncbi:hypothetical protein SKAU_G00215300 [Synaphobranchus kaupii]|uniref:Uncharacterized protein n=1 Tax=Synaphobranchus kaupii TaxID=118154 RepID=A0A9Q1F9P8_SYNKA|nr:hypothetical protein SKAU_G00215300 [Synaphobranchus kaupii]
MYQHCGRVPTHLAEYDSSGINGKEELNEQATRAVVCRPACRRRTTEAPAFYGFSTPKTQPQIHFRISKQPHPDDSQALASSPRRACAAERLRLLTRHVPHVRKRHQSMEIGQCFLPASRARRRLGLRSWIINRHTSPPAALLVRLQTAAE